ncbi:hypothetical protein BDV26DRAFT_299350 [Aspergillus bertholletiae]|uniref:Uncharacterized protein n=1 Tax=Aspergillus bertholletiae TaxID=1226010 RepID=A0A5N7BQ50_9EURO|nr:hypothetical protein BDV26DRAFT_299350 [Aspergillus bertholletiae]
MAVGLLRVWLQPKDSVDEVSFHKWRLAAFSDIPGVFAVDILTATDEVSPENHYRYENAYHIGDVQKITELLVQRLRNESNRVLERSDWQIYERICHHERDHAGERLTGTVFITVGMSPTETPENIRDFHEWYDQEHLPILFNVPGWRTGSRYRRTVSYGDKMESVSPYLAVHQYNEKNGLGGEQWSRSIHSPWTKRVQSNLVAPNHRRVWKLVKGEVIRREE